MTFRFVARAVAAVCAVLFIVLFAFPTFYTPTYGVATDDNVDFMTRRASPMFAGMAVVLWAAATAPRSALRSSVALGGAVMFVGVAMTGAMSFAQGIAGPTILVAAAFECLAAGLLWATRKN